MDGATDEKDFAAEGTSTYSPETSPRSVQKDDSKPRVTHQRLVLTDPAAFRYLEEDPSTTVLGRRQVLHGYELYVVEQWACSRKEPTFVITTYTGIEQNSVVVGVLSVPTDEQAWSPRLRVYLQAITKYHARKKETPLGTLMVTNLSTFPSAYTVIQVPDGDLKKHREDFIVNENLKRMGCSGRAGLNLATPTGATQSKFGLTYHTSDRIPLYKAVIELVKLCQVALILFGKLAPAYADGLVCDVTEQAISDWWTEIGIEYYSTEPSDGPIGPTTVAALLGTAMGARNRLNAFGAPVTKDVFDIVSTKRAIAYFQKSQKIDRTRRLDRETLNRLHKVTAKAASGEGWTMPRAVKSTVAELSGKGGDLLNKQDRAGIAEVETLDIDTFIQYGSGERFKWLWQGKPRKHIERDILSNRDNNDIQVFNENHGLDVTWSSSKKDFIDDDSSLRYNPIDGVYLGSSNGSQISVDRPEKDQAFRKAVLKNVTGKVADARSGLGRMVGRKGHRGHAQKYSKDNNLMSDGESLRETPPRTSYEEPNASAAAEPMSQLETSPPDSGEQSLNGSKDSSRRASRLPDETGKDISGTTAYRPTAADDISQSRLSLEAPAVSNASLDDSSNYMSMIDHAAGIRRRNEWRETVDGSRTGFTVGDEEAIKKMQNYEAQYSNKQPLRTTKSLPRLNAQRTSHWEKRWPRHLSFTTVADVLATSTGPDLINTENLTSTDGAISTLAYEKGLLAERRFMGVYLESIKTSEASWVEEKVSQIEVYDQQAGSHQAKLDLIYHQKFDEYNALHDASEDTVSEERRNLAEAIKDVEILGAKLEYELSALESKVEDVESGVAEFERQVLQIEIRAEELDENRAGDNGWIGWLMRNLKLGYARS